MAGPQAASGEWEQAPGVMVPTLDTWMQLSPSFPRAPQEPLLSAGTPRPAWHPPSGTPGCHSGLATHTELLKERLHEAGAVAQGRCVDVHVVHVLPWERGGCFQPKGGQGGSPPPRKHQPKDTGSPPHCATGYSSGAGTGGVEESPGMLPPPPQKGRKVGRL